MEKSLPVSAAYDFTHSGAGGYSIKPSNLFTYVDAGGTLKNLYADIEDVAGVKLSGNLAVPRGVYDKREGIRFQNCTPDEESVISHAVTWADYYAEEAYEYLKSILSSTLRYTWWFGLYTRVRKELVQSHFEKISRDKLSSLLYVCHYERCRSTTDAIVRACIFQP